MGDRKVNIKVQLKNRLCISNYSKLNIFKYYFPQTILKAVKFGSYVGSIFPVKATTIELRIHRTYQKTYSLKLN